jgi:Amt family ammonium transporter
MQAEINAAGQAPLRQEARRARITIDALVDGVVATDSAGVVQLINPAAETLLGVDYHDAIGSTLDSIINLEFDETLPKSEYVPDLVKLARGDTGGDVGDWGERTVSLRSRAGSAHIVQLAALRLVDDDGADAGISIVLRDQTAATNLAAKLSHEASHDLLTGLPNRREFERRLAQVVADVADSDEQHALCYLDLDQFKIVNDTCGHAAADELLNQLAQGLASRLRAADFLARIGGDEFTVILNNCPLDDAQRIAESIRQWVESFRFYWAGNTYKIGISIGLVPINTEAGSVDVLLQSADAACYMAKDAGRNAVHVHREEDRKQARRRGEIRWVS